MRSLTSDNFGPLIAYLLPGFVAVLGVSNFSETVRSWLSVSPTTVPTVGGFLYVTLASTAAGLIVSAVRWAVIDTLMHRTGIPEPAWNFGRLQERIDAFLALVDAHYRFYQFYSNVLVAVTFAYVAHLVTTGFGDSRSLWLHLGFALVWVVLFVGSRDTLRKYHTRAAALLDEPPVVTRHEPRRLKPGGAWSLRSLPPPDEEQE